MDEIYSKYYLKIYNWSLKKTNNKEDAEDLTNNIFVAIFEYLSKDIKIEKVENLIWKIAHNLWCNKAKKYIKEKELMCYELTDVIGYEDITIDKIIYREIINDIDKIGLSDNEIKAFKMYYLNDLSINEISSKLNTIDSNVKYYLYSARNKIKERYHG